MRLRRVVDRRRGWSGRPPLGASKISFFSDSSVPVLLASCFGSLLLLVGCSSANANIPLAKDQLHNVSLTAAGEATTGLKQGPTEEEDTSVPAVAESPAFSASLVQTPRTEKRNVVLVHLESTRAQSVTPYNQDLQTTPFLNELATESIVTERTHVIVPRSSKGSTAVNCGVEPALYAGPEYEPGSISAPCLASLLKEQGYRTVWFQSLWDYGSDRMLAENFGYEKFYPAQSMNAEDFRVTNTFGYEDDIMLEPSEQWLEIYGNDDPFLAQYFTGTGHYDYQCVPNRYGYEYFSENEELDRYHNCLRMLDFFVKNLMDQYKEMGLYEDTIFVIFGDHGEGFGEHGRSMHGDTIYDEGLRIPLIIHDPRRFEDGERVEGLSSQIDILPTVLEMLGYTVRNGEYPGYSLLREPPEDRALRFSCITKRTCMASIQGYEKYIYHYENQPDELFDLSEDPLEQNDRAGSLSSEELEERREYLLEWRTRVNAVYGGEE